MRAVLRTTCPALAAATVIALTAPAAGAQRALSPSSGEPTRRLEITRPAPVTGEAGQSVTVAIRATNLSVDSLRVVPRIALPSDWATLLGAFPFSLAPREGDTWLVSLRIPGAAPAGRYVIQLRAADAEGVPLLHDSMLVDVPARHRVAVALANRPPFAISGTSYHGVFLVQNRGNVAATILLRATSSLGHPLDVPRSIAVGANESKLVRVGVTPTLVGQEARDDVVELHATDASDAASEARASLRITVVQRAGSAEPLHTVASTLRLRAANAATGVAPLELTGAGLLRDGGAEQIEYVVRARPSAIAGFGDRDEYHLGLRAPGYRAQMGDGLYSVSPLSSAGLRGIGGGLELGDSTMGAGAYMQQFRYQPDRVREQGGFVRVGTSGALGSGRLDVNAVNRAGGPLAGRIIGASTRLIASAGIALDVEYARSRGIQGNGSARSARLSGGEAIHFDAAHLEADASFAGNAQGSTYDFLNANTVPWKAFRLSGSGSRYRRVASFASSAAAESRSGLLELSYDNHYTIGYSAQVRGARSLVGRGADTQRGFVARAEGQVERARLWGSAEAGVADDMLSPLSHAYRVLSIGASAPIGAHMLSLFGETSEGARLLRGADRALTLGFDARIQLGAATTAGVSGSNTRTFVPDGGYSYLDARLTHTLPRGASVSMRMRFGGRDIRDAALGQKLAYAEYSMPLALPVGPSRTMGRVRGRVVDEQTGRGVSGALVRLGPQAAITDQNGRVAFAGLPAGAYRLALAQQLASGATVFTGDPNVQVDEGVRTPATFQVAVETAGSVTGSVRRMLIARTGMGAASDSLVDGGALEGVSVALVGVRDTLYRTTDGAGAFAFTDVPSGAWTVIVLAESPAQMQWDQERIPLVMRAGDAGTATFRLVPKRRRVRIVSGDGIDDAAGSAR